MSIGNNVYEWTLRPPPGSVDGLLVAFALTRTRFQLVSLEHEGRSLLLGRTESGSRFFVLERGYPAGARLRVAYDGNAPLIAHIAWIQARPASKRPFVYALPTWFAELFEGSAKDERDPPAPVFLEKFADLAAIGEVLEPREVRTYVQRHEPRPAELFRNRERAIDWHYRAQQFFLRMDLETKYELVPSRWQGTIQRIGDRLAHRLEVRARLGNSRPAQVPDFGAIDRTWSIGWDDMRTLEAVSTYLCNLITSSLENYGGTQLVAWAFEMFATDRLAVHHVDLDTHRFLQGHGAANGLVFLQMGEFAFYCLDNDVDVEFWRRHLDALVRSTHAFLETARDPTIVGPGPHTPPAYEFHEGRLHRRTRLDELRGESDFARRASAKAGKDELLFLADRFTSLVSQARPDCTGTSTARSRDLTHGHEAEIKPRGVYPWP